jgi:hypothetical protein
MNCQLIKINRFLSIQKRIKFLTVNQSFKTATSTVKNAENKSQPANEVRQESSTATPTNSKI